MEQVANIAEQSEERVGKRVLLDFVAMHPEFKEGVEKTDFKRLQTKYPWGFAVYYIDRGAEPLVSKPGNGPLDVDWTTVKLLSIAEDFLVVQAPDWSDSRMNNSVQGFRFGASRRRGEVTPVRFDTYELYFEILDNQRDGVLAVVGFRPLPEARRLN